MFEASKVVDKPSNVMYKLTFVYALIIIAERETRIFHDHGHLGKFGE